MKTKHGLLMWTSLGLFGAGDSKPITPGSSELIPVDITLTVP